MKLQPLQCAPFFILPLQVFVVKVEGCPLEHFYLHQHIACRVAPHHHVLSLSHVFDYLPIYFAIVFRFSLLHVVRT